MVWNWISVGFNAAVVIVLLFALRREAKPEGRGLIVTLLVLAFVARLGSLIPALLG